MPYSAGPRAHQANQVVDGLPAAAAAAAAAATAVAVGGLQQLGQPLAELIEQVARDLLQLDVSVLGGVHRGAGGCFCAGGRGG